MVSALKSYNNKYQKNNNALKTVVNKFAELKTQTKPLRKPEKKSFVDKSVQNLAVNSIIEGYFPKENLIKETAIKRMNKLLCVILSLLILVAITSYYFVVSGEIKLSNLTRETIVLNNENEELQIKLDSMKSFNNVDATLQKNNILQKAGRVIEAPEIISIKENEKTKKEKKALFNYAIGF